MFTNTCTRIYLVPKMPFLNYHDPVLFLNFLPQAVALVMSAGPTDILLQQASVFLLLYFLAPYIHVVF